MSGEKKTNDRFALVDALRGIAAVWVATFHFYGGLSAHAGSPFSWPIDGSCAMAMPVWRSFSLSLDS